MEYQEQLQEWKKNRERIYKEVMEGKESKRQIAIKYGLSNTRITDICRQVEKDKEKSVL